MGRQLRTLVGDDVRDEREAESKLLPPPLGLEGGGSRGCMWWTSVCGDGSRLGWADLVG
jgi:hypothetical protein